jgi:RNA polymerase sigma factor for flagellar operon FliA
MMLHQEVVHESLTYGRAPALPDCETLVRAHASMVRRIAWQVHSRMSSAIALEDLIQIGLLSLVEAAKGFEDRGASFGPYAATRIRGAMIDHLRREARMCRSGMVSRRELARVRDELENRLHRRATDAEMADAMNLDPQAYHAKVASSLSQQLDSIEEVYSDHDGWFADLAAGADSEYDAAELRKDLAACLSALAEREAMVLQLYFVEELNLDEIGAVLGVGAARVCQIKRSALIRMRKMMSARHGEDPTPA